MATQLGSEAQERKLRSENLLREQNVPINSHLPVIETEDEANIQSSEAVALRALSLLIVAAKGEGLEQRRVDELVAKYSVQECLSPSEKAFVANPAPSQHVRTQFCWRYEAAWTLLWALGFIESLGRPVGICELPRAIKIASDRTRAQFVSDARLRPAADLLDQADLIYRYHWAIRNAQLRRTPAPEGFSPDVVVERHHALNWLVGYCEQDWDDVTTDT